MRLVLKETKLLRNKETLEEGRNIGTTISKKIVREIANQFAKRKPDPKKDFIVDLRPLIKQLAEGGELEGHLKAQGNKKFARLQNLIKYFRYRPTMGLDDNLGSYSLYDDREETKPEKDTKKKPKKGEEEEVDMRVMGGTIFVKMPAPYSLAEYNLAFETKKNPAKIGSFQTALKNGMKSVLEKYTSFKYHPNAYGEWTDKVNKITFERAVEIYQTYKKQTSLLPFLPEYTTSETVNLENIKEMKDRSYPKYTTQQDIDKVVDKPFEEQTIKEKIYKIFYQEKDKEGYDMGSRLSTLVHEVFHGRDDLANKDLEAKSATLLPDEFLLSLPPKLYIGQGPYNPMDKKDFDMKKSATKEFYYWAEPYEIKARLAQYRAKHAELKKENASTADSKIYDIFLEKEEKHANSVADKLNVEYTYRNYVPLLKRELKSKVLAQVFGQAVATSKDLTKDPRFKESAEKYRAEAESVTNEIMNTPDLKRMADGTEPRKGFQMARSLILR